MVVNGAIASTMQIKNGRRRAMTLGRASMTWSTNQIRRLLIAWELTAQ